jgi:hypothetical protein
MSNRITSHTVDAVMAEARKREDKVILPGFEHPHNVRGQMDQNWLPVVVFL